MGYEIKLSRLTELGLFETDLYFTAAFNATEAMRVNRAVEVELINKRAEKARDIAAASSNFADSLFGTIRGGDCCVINGINVSMSFLYNLNYEDFINHARNFFDYLAHIIYLVYLRDKKKIDEIDFGKLIKNRSLIDNAEISDLISTIETNDLFTYISDYNNITKHNHGINTPINTNFRTFEMVGMVFPFSKEIKGVERTHDLALMRDKMKEIHQFVLDSQQAFLKEFDKIYTQEGNEK